MNVHIGTSGWSYDHWQGVLYPHGVAPWQRLEYYIKQFQTVELNSSFYRWPTLAAFKSWQRRLPQHFLLSVKAPRGLTHAKRLYAPEKWIDRITRCWHELSDKRAVLLVQLSPHFAPDYKRLEYFLKLIPEWMRVCYRVPSSRLACGCYLPVAGTIQGSLLHYEWSTLAMCVKGYGPLSIFADAWSGQAAFVCRFLFRHRPALVEKPYP